MNQRQGLVTVLIILILIYVGLGGLFYTHANGRGLAKYILYIVSVIPSISLLIGVLTRVLFQRSDIIKRYVVSGITCFIVSVIMVILYALFNRDFAILLDIIGFGLYCIIINVILLIINSLINIAGVNYNRRR